MKTPFIWVGSGRAKKRGVARRGRLLDQVGRAGLPVPNGAILLDELFRILLREGVVERVGDKVFAPDPLWLQEVLYRDVRLPRLRTTADISVIPADGVEDWLTPATAVRDVDLEDSVQLASALSGLWSFPAANDKFRRDLLLVACIKAETEGRAISLSNGEDVVYNYTSVADGDEVEPLSLPRLGRWQRPSAELAPYARRVQLLLRGVRRTLHDEDAFDFYWADDGEVCWIKLFN